LPPQEHMPAEIMFRVWRVSLRLFGENGVAGLIEVMRFLRRATLLRRAGRPARYYLERDNGGAGRATANARCGRLRASGVARRNTSVRSAERESEGAARVSGSRNASRNAQHECPA